MYRSQIISCNNEIAENSSKLSQLESEKSHLESRKNEIINEINSLKGKFSDLESKINSQISLMNQYSELNKNNISNSEKQLSNAVSIKLDSFNIKKMIEDYKDEKNFFDNESKKLSDFLKSKKLELGTILEKFSISLNSHELNEKNMLEAEHNLKAPCYRCSSTKYNNRQYCNNKHDFCDFCAKYSVLSYSCPICDATAFNSNYVSGSSDKDFCNKCGRNDYSVKKKCNQGHFFCDKCQEGVLFSNCPICNGSAFSVENDKRNPKSKICSRCGSSSYSKIQKCSKGHESCSNCVVDDYIHDLCPVCNEILS